MNRVSGNDFFADFSALTDLKARAQKDPDAALKDVAQEFEAIFIDMLFKNMRSANDEISSGLFDSNQFKQYQEMMDTQLAQSLAKSGGIGLADALIRQYGGEGKQSVPSADNHSTLLSNLAPIPADTLRAVARRASQEFARQVSEASQQMASITETPTTAAPKAEEVAFASPEEFIDTLWPLAQKTAQRIGVDPKAILAQAALETGWGKYPIAKEDGTASFNLFGIKADSRWQGDRAVVNTLEYRDGIAKKERAAFRAYDSFAHSFDDYANFLSTSERYKNALNSRGDATTFAANLQRGGYATDPNYADKIGNILASKWFRTLL
ncbi:flagellar assembly peptidoglycan hydrolase FlgJ [Maribrevibacterium harenarium]|uniref:Peptidoglycan hydrolase FlgJ n=1 Tax=Maribrevibacterium harenarium TaxID=2589817 RepID=A0A501X358_9GAMM|nr:flagellar assembly peptidoglycan hydrolase FlgJ [Maribrevibacterium harenarium]TPE54922.1 flagellar assembly peptidoglycan hydrolase FlgJ [Maribrevibacterium harenarium]